MKDVLLLVGAGQLGMAIAGRVGFNYKILIGEKKLTMSSRLRILWRGLDMIL